MKECVNSLSIVYGILVFFSYCLLEDEEEHNIDAFFICQLLPLFDHWAWFNIRPTTQHELIDQIQCRKMHLNGGCRGFHTLKMQFK